MVSNTQETGIESTLTELVALLDWAAGWNGYDSPAPSRQAVKQAIVWIGKLHVEVLRAERAWIGPNVTAGPDGEVVLEWWHDTKKLTIYIEEQDVDYVKVWGTDAHSQMAEGDARSSSACRALWLWLTE